MIFFTPPDVGGNAMPRSTTYGQCHDVDHGRQTQRQHLKKKGSKLNFFGIPSSPTYLGHGGLRGSKGTPKPTKSFGAYGVANLIDPC